MKEIKRPALLSGLIITTFEVVLYIIAQLITKNSEIIAKVIFGVCIVILLFNVSSFYTVNLTAKEFKTKRYLCWTSFTLTFLYGFYYLAVIIMNLHNGIQSNDTLMIANLFVICMGLLLYIPGILKKIIDDKITYDEHINQAKKSEE